MSLAEDTSWPPSPIPATPTLLPITSWAEMYQETLATGVMFESCWLDSVEAGVAYFFRWVGTPRATVLAVWNEDSLSFVECRGTRDRLLTATESQQVMAEIHRLFSRAGYSISVGGNA